MKLITRQDKANSAANWIREYYYRFSFQADNFGWKNKDAEAMYNKLIALGETPDPDDVDTIIPAWTLSTCSECELSVDAVVRVHESVDNEDSDVDLCLDCLKIASDLAGAAR